MIVAGSANPLLMGVSTGYNLTRSLRFRKSATAYLSRTFTSVGNRKTWTFSVWLKKSRNGEGYEIFGSDYGDPYVNGYMHFNFQSSPADALNSDCGPEGTRVQANTSAIYRDPSAWYHIVIAFDTTQATAANRIKYYVNGVQQTMTGNYPAQNYEGLINTAGGHSIGYRMRDNDRYFDGYMTEINFIDGQALTPSSFGQTSSTTGVWQPKKYTGTYGTNGFYLPFTDNSALTSGSNAGLGKDFSGNGNYWNTNNISITSGSTYDSMTDVPTLTSATAANFCTLNPLSTSSYVTISGGNLNTTGNTSADEGVCGSTFMVKTGKWYTEFTVTGSIVSNRPNYGIIPNPNANFANGGGQFANTGGMRYGPDGKVYTSGSLVGTFSTFTTGDVIGIAIDADNGAAYVSKNGTWQNSGVPTSGSSKTGAVVTWTGGTVDYFVCVDEYNGTTSSTNFGQRSFNTSPPTGYVALNTYNLPTPTIGATASSQANKYFDATLYTGNGVSGLQVTNAGSFQPDLVWVKVRNASDYHNVADVIRGVNKRIFTNDTQVENTNTETLQSFNSNGFTVGNNGNWNTSGGPLVAWQWKANGTGILNTTGSISATVSANTTSGFSIVVYTSTTGTVGHGLGVAPSMIIMKATNLSDQWTVGHKDLNGGSSPWNYGIPLNTSAATQTNSGFWNNTAPTSTVFSQGSWDSGYTKVAYCFAEIAGYSKIGSFIGNGSTDGTFVYTGFRPKYIMSKSTSAARFWFATDTSRDPYNVCNLPLFPNDPQGETAGTTDFDILSNGFKARTTNAAVNGNGETIIYIAFAENPFKYSLAR